MIKKFQLGGGVPQVFNIDVPQQPVVNLGSVINAASMPIDSGVDTYSKLKQVEFNQDRINIEKDREERMKTADKINNLKLISEFADKASQWGVLPGDQKTLDSMLGELNDPNFINKAVTTQNGAADYVGKYIGVSGQVNPLLRKRKIYDEAVKQHTDIYNKYLSLIPNAADAMNLDFNKKMTEWGDRLERFANGDPTVSQTSITPAGMGIEDMITPEGLKSHIEEAKLNSESKRLVEKAKVAELGEELEIKKQVREGQYNNAKERLKITTPNAELTPEQDALIKAEVARPAVEAKIAETNLAIAKTAAATFETVGLKLKNITQWSKAASAINQALPDGKQVIEQDLSDLEPILKTLTPDELKKFFDSIDNNKEFSQLFSGKEEFSAEYRSYLDYIKRPGNENITYPEFRSTSSSVNYNGTSSSSKDGTEVKSAKIGNTWVSNDAEFKKKYKDKASFVVSTNPVTGKDQPYMMFSHADNEETKQLLHELTGWAYVDEGWAWFDLNTSEFDTTKVPGSYHKNGILYVPIDQQSSPQQSKAVPKVNGKPAAPTTVPQNKSSNKNW